MNRPSPAVLALILTSAYSSPSPSLTLPLHSGALEAQAMRLMLSAMWAGNVLDIQKTLHYVCKRLLREEGISKEQAKLRAKVCGDGGCTECPYAACWEDATCSSA